MSAASSEATEQLVVSARTHLLQVQNMLETQRDEGAGRLREAQVAFITTRRDRSSSTSASHESDLLMAKNQITRPLEDRVVLRKESLIVRDIPSRKLPFGCVMRLREKSE